MKIIPDSFSASKIMTLVRCMFAYECIYIRQERVAEHPDKIFGSALHWMFKRFFQVNFSSLETFLGTWKRFWWEVVNQKHGPDGFRDRRIVKIGFTTFHRPPPEYYFVIGQKILGDFFARNLKYKEKWRPEVEKKFKIRTEGILLEGKWDRLQPSEKGIEIWDYKAYPFNSVETTDDLQFTFYQLAFTNYFNFPPSAMKVVSYRGYREDKSGRIYRVQKIPLRTEQNLRELLVLLKEAAVFLASLERREVIIPNFVFQYFDPCWIPKGILPPRLPRGPHCRYCEFIRQCRQREMLMKKGQVPPIRTEVWTSKRGQEAYQLAIPFR